MTGHFTSLLCIIFTTVNPKKSPSLQGPSLEALLLQNSETEQKMFSLFLIPKELKSKCSVIHLMQFSFCAEKTQIYKTSDRNGWTDGEMIDLLKLCGEETAQVDYRSSDAVVLVLQGSPNMNSIELIRLCDKIESY